MLDWLKYLPFASRDDHYPSQVKGPYFSKMLENNWVLGDLTFYFSAPKSNPILSFTHRGSKFEGRSPRKNNILQSDLERVYGGKANGESWEWDLRVFYNNVWYFVGPWFSGEQARLQANAWLATAEKGSEFEDKNLFHPKLFESAISTFLDGRYGHDKVGRTPLYRGPLSWKILPISDSINAVQCDIHTIGNTSKENPWLQRLIFFPVSSTQFVEINFDFGGVNILHDEVRSKPLLRLCGDIVDSFRLEVGEHTLSEWNRVKEFCPDMSITETMGEFHWPLKRAKIPEKEFEVDITPTQKVIENGQRK